MKKNNRMKKQYLFLIAIVGSLTLTYTSVNRMNSRSDTTLGWWTEAMASDSESGGSTATLDCGKGIGACQGECGDCDTKLTGTGAGAVTFTCNCP